MSLMRKFGEDKPVQSMADIYLLLYGNENTSPAFGFLSTRIAGGVLLTQSANFFNLTAQFYVKCSHVLILGDLFRKQFFQLLVTMLF